MTSNWHLEGSGEAVTPSGVAQLLQDRIRDGELWTHLLSGSGLALMFVTNGERAMVVLVGHEGDAGQHLVDAGASGESTGFMLDNGQVDTYANQDTVPLSAAIDAVQHVMGGDLDRPGAWADDR